jgi:rfaE bifunctional protein nucleotidyltransferase chain/domain
MILKSIIDLKKLRLKFKNKRIGLCHGVFDILHKGHLDHFNYAKKKCDLLIVSVTSNKFINKGPRQPYNDENERVFVLDGLKSIDYTYLNKKPDSIELIKNLKPNIYFKGPDYLKLDVHGNLKKEINTLKKNNGTIVFTKTDLLSSTKIFNNQFTWSNEQKEFIKKISKNNFKSIQDIFNQIATKKITIIGEPILDSYKICDIIGITTKDPTISILDKSKETYPGGVLAVAKMASQFVNQVNLITYGSNKILKKTFKKIKNIKLFNINKKNNIQTKTRFVSSNRGEKLLQVTNFKNKFFSIEDQNKIINILKKDNNAIIICDFGIGLFEDKLIKYLNSIKKKKYINVQTNSVNLGFNLFTKYTSGRYICLDSREWALGLKKTNFKNEDLLRLLDKFLNLSVTKGREGSSYICKSGSINAPVFVKSVRDTTGSGDSYYLITSLLNLVNCKKELVPFIGNLYAGMQAQHVGNKKIIEKKELLSNIKSIINI